MYTRIVLHKDKENFGNTVVVYKSSSNYLVITKDRDEVSYYFLDKDINMMYPMNTYMKQIEFEYSFENADVQLDRIFDVDLSMYGSSICPDNLKKLVIDSSKNKKNRFYRAQGVIICKEFAKNGAKLILNQVLG